MEKQGGVPYLARPLTAVGKLAARYEAAKWGKSIYKTCKKVLKLLYPRAKNCESDWIIVQ